MNENVDVRRVGIFIAIAFGLSWLFALILYLNGGLESPLALPLLALGFMMMPALANVLTRVITREGWSNAWLRPNIRRGWPYWAAAWVLPPLLVIIGGAVYFLVYPQFFDPNLTQLQEMLPQTGINPWVVIALNIAQAILIAPVINGLFTFGEEFGWRGYLLPKLMPLGGRKAVIISGIIWGVWHWPIIAMGHNYGVGYPGYPWSGMLMMVWFTVMLGAFVSWVTLRGGSVWPAVIAHAAINGMGALPALMMQGEPNRLIGPFAAGALGGIAITVVGLALLLSPRALEPASAPAAAEAAPVEGPESALG